MACKRLFYYVGVVLFKDKQTSLISFLTEPTPVLGIRTVEELSRSGMKYGAVNRSFNHLHTSEDSQFQNVLQNIILGDNLTVQYFDLRGMK
jgi:hypothetical protein